MTALHTTCQLGDVQAARNLIGKGVDLDATVETRTKLYFALIYRRTALVQLLIENSASSNSRNRRQSALHLAMNKSCTAAEHILLDHVANPHTLVSDNMCCAFHKAVEKGTEACS